MNPDPIIGRRLFVDGIVRPVHADDGGHQYVIDLDGHTRYGRWLPGDEADSPLVLAACGVRRVHFQSSSCLGRVLSRLPALQETFIIP
jgi:hypothetical protein